MARIGLLPAIADVGSARHAVDLVVQDASAAVIVAHAGVQHSPSARSLRLDIDLHVLQALSCSC
jgi:hypothetical protein